MSSNADSLIREAISVYREGEKDQARNLLLQAVDIDERNEEAWLWLSAVVDTPEDQITCLENVLTINPENPKAKQGLSILNEKLSATPPAMPSAPPAPSAAFTAAPEEEEDDPFANISFTEPSTAFEQSPFIDEPTDDEELPDSGVWDAIATSSPSAVPAAPVPAPEVYNDWIAGLNIGTNEAGEAFGVDDDLFDEGPFTGGDAFELDRAVFSQVDDDEDEFLNADDGPFSTSPFTADLDFDDEDDGDDEPAAVNFPPPAAPPAPRQPTSIPLQSPAPRAEDRILSSFDDEDDFDDADFYGDDYDEDLVAVDPSEFFRFIPAEIKASRLPGTRERYPAMVILSLVLLFVLNIGAVALVFMTLSNGG